MQPPRPEDAHREAPEWVLSGETRIAARHQPGNGPRVVFLGGFRSDMQGTKARALAAWCARRGQAFTRFDYRGHGESQGTFAAATVGHWRADALAVLDATQEPLLLVGSSMGAWIMLLAALARPARVFALLGVAAAPDFTERLLWPGLNEEQRRRLNEHGSLALRSAYEDEPFSIGRDLIEDGRRHLLLDAPVALRSPLRLLHGLADTDVPWQLSQQLLEGYEGDDARLCVVKGADHRFSAPAQLALLLATLEELLHRD